MLLTIYNIYTKKSEIIKTSVEEQKDTYLDNVYKLKNSFFASFYEQAIESIVADAYEYFVEMDCENNFFYQNLKLMNNERGKRFLKIMSMYYTILVVRKKRKDIDQDEMREALIEAFELNEKEQKLYDLLYTCKCRFESQFPSLFAKAFAKYLFGKDDCGVFALAFIENFCYNSYSCFMLSFTKYFSINLRIKKAAN